MKKRGRKKVSPKKKATKVNNAAPESIDIVDLTKPAPLEKKTEQTLEESPQKEVVSPVKDDLFGGFRIVWKPVEDNHQLMNESMSEDSDHQNIEIDNPVMMYFLCTL